MKPVPDELMIPIGAEATARLKKCADNWSDSEVAELRVTLPLQYHAVPLDALRRQFINIRKKGTEGFRLNGIGPTKGSRSKKSKPVPPGYQDYLDSESWKSRRNTWLAAWNFRCALCNKSDVPLDIHHRTYERLGS